MAYFFNAVSSVVIIFLLTAVGYFCAAKGWTNQAVKTFISKFLMNLAIPCMCIHGLTTNLSRDAISGSWSLLLIAVLVSSASILLSAGVGVLLKLPHKRRGVFVMMCGLSNALFIGYAMCSVLFGEACTPYVMMFYLVNTTFVQLVGIPSVAWSGEGEGSSVPKLLLRLLRSPTVISVFISFALLYADVQLPAVVLSFMRYMNNTVTPLALLLTGHIIYEIGLKNLRMDLSLFLVACFRFLFAPAMKILLCRVFGISGLARSVFVVESAMPVVTQTVVVATEYKADAEYAAQGAALTTLLSFLVIPILMIIL